MTANTNLPRLRAHVRPVGVMLLSMRRRMEKARATSAEMTATELRQALNEASEQAAQQESFFDEIADETANAQEELSRYKDKLNDTQDELRQKNAQLKSLKDALSAGGHSSSGVAVFDPERLLKLAAQKEEPSPLECVELIEQVYGDRCTVLDSARESARKMIRFVYGRDLLDLLARLVTTYRDALLDGGDTKAREAFGRNEYAAKESEVAMKNKAIRRQRTFDYAGTQVEMFRHLKIGVDDDRTRTIRVHFHWDGDRRRIVIGYCGEHLPVPSH